VIISQQDADLSITPILPLLKWAGGKRWLSDELIAAFPDKIKRYYEPFLGGAAVFFALRPRRATLSDSNSELINCYQQVQQHPELVLKSLNKLRNSEANYYRVREASPEEPIDRAARLLFLTTLSFNGIYRQNLAGVFNVPYGKKTHVNPADATRLLAASEALQTVRLKCSDFEEATQGAGRGDLVYLDPPYTVAHGNNGFVKYNAKIFSWDDQIRLACIARRLSDRGCFVFVSNADHISIRNLYKDFQLRVVERQSKIAATAKHRKQISECLFFNHEVISARTS